jgi:hypothetical protein
MKKIVIALLIFFMMACSQDKKKEKSNNMITNNNFTLVYNFPFDGEILINDVVLDKSLFNTFSGTEFINSYILNNGYQKISIKLFSPYLKKGKTINPNELRKAGEEFALYNTILENDEIKELNLIQKLDFPNNDVPLPIVMHEWKFQANLPFKLQGWKDAENLNSWDKDKLERVVVDKFKQLQGLLNQGQTEAFLKELEFSNNEYFIANYYSENKKYEYLKNLRVDFSLLKGNVPPINNYRMRIMGDGRVVTLETLGKYEGQGILTTEDTIDKKLYPIYIMLYKPLNSSDFKIVRFFSYKVCLIK